MDALFEALAKLLGVFKDPATVAFLIVSVAEGYYILSLRKENREDFGKMVDTLVQVKDALNNVKNVLSAMTGKAL